jgi:hypothetical protein
MARWAAQPERLLVHAGDWPSLEAYRSGEPLEWLSPRADGDWRELRDEMWETARLPWPSPQQTGWWPKGGPQWDGVAMVLGSSGQRGVLLVEAKSHTAELASSIDASDRSAAVIEKALDETRRYLGGRSRRAWTDDYYQAANRLAWLYMLRVKRGLAAWLLSIYFIGDSFESTPAKQRDFPPDEAGWATALAGMKRSLGLPERHPLSPWLREAFVPARS